MLRNVRDVVAVGALILLMAALSVSALASAASDIQSGKELMDKGDYGAAIQIFSQIADPAFAPEALRLTGLCYQRMGDYSQAIAVYNTFLATYSTQTEACDGTRAWLAECCLLTKDWEGARQLYQPLLSSHPEGAARWQLGIGISYQEQGDYPHAVTALKAALDAVAAAKDPTLSPLTIADIKSRFAECVLRTNDWENAAEMYQVLASENPEGKVRWLLGAGISYQAQGKYVQASTALKDALDAVVVTKDSSLSPLTVKDIKARLAECYLMQEDYDQALAAYQSFADEYSDGAERAKLMIGVCYQRKGDNERALSILNDLQASSNNPEAVRDAMLNSCDCLCQPGRVDEALAMLDKSYEEHTDWRADILLEKGQVLADYRRDYASALDTFKKLIADFPDWPRLHEVQRRTGLTLINLRQVAEAKAHFSKLALADPNDGEWAFYLAYCVYREDNWAEARDAILASYNGFPNGGEWRAQAGYFYGECCTRLGDDKEAMAAFQEIVSTFSGNFWANEAKMRLDKLQSQYSNSEVTPAKVTSKLTSTKDKKRISAVVNTSIKSAALPPKPVTVAVDDKPKQEVN